MKQKSPRGTRIKVIDKMPRYMRHFECGFIGIVGYTLPEIQKRVT